MAIASLVYFFGSNYDRFFRLQVHWYSLQIRCRRRRRTITPTTSKSDLLVHRRLCKALLFLFILEMIAAKKFPYRAPAFVQAIPLHALRSIPTQSRTKQRAPRWRSQLHTSSRRAIEPTTFRLAPSDFAFLWEECPRCFYLKVHRKMYRPRAPFPSIFSNIDMAMKRHFKGLRTQDVLPEMPPGTFLCDEEDAWVECEPIRPPGRRHSVYIRGMVCTCIFTSVRRKCNCSRSLSLT